MQPYHHFPYSYLVFPPAPPPDDISWEKSKDNIVHAPKPCKSVRRKSLLIGVRLAKERRMGENESGWNKNTSSLIMEMRTLN